MVPDHSAVSQVAPKSKPRNGPAAPAAPAAPVVPTAPTAPAAPAGSCWFLLVVLLLVAKVVLAVVLRPPLPRERLAELTDAHGHYGSHAHLRTIPVYALIACHRSALSSTSITYGGPPLRPVPSCCRLFDEFQ